MAEKRIFRQAALDRLASPEQLDHLVPVVEARGWVALAGCALLALGALAWGFTGSLPVTLAARGTLTGNGQALLRVPAGAAAAVRPGMEVVLLPGDAALRGTVEQVAPGGDGHRLVRVAVAPSGHAAGTPADGRIVLSRRRPVALLVPALQ
jgi:HlyD family secretion protein